MTSASFRAVVIIILNVVVIGIVLVVIIAIDGNCDGNYICVLQFTSCLEC